MLIVARGGAQSKEESFTNMLHGAACFSFDRTSLYLAVRGQSFWTHFEMLVDSLGDVSVPRPLSAYVKRPEVGDMGAAGDRGVTEG